MRRRTFLLVLATLGGACGLRRAAGAARDGAAVQESDPYVADLSRSLAGNAAVRSVGHAYLEQVPEEDDRTLLIELVSTPRREDDAGLPRQPARIFEQVRQDFAANRITRVHGWLLSPTEARLCALTVARDGKAG